MSWFRNLFQSKDPSSALNALQEKFKAFLSLLETNHQVLKIIADMEEKTEGEYLFDINYIRTSLDEIRSGVSSIIEDMITLGGERYAVLRDRYREIDSNTESLFSGNHPIPKDEFTLPLDRIGRERAGSVGSKSAQIGELRKLGLPTPDGFAITAWAYKHFLDANDLQDRISEKLHSLDIKSYEQLVSVSDEIQATIKSCKIPEDLATAIGESLQDLSARTPSKRFALRSSAIGEDTRLSFAGQYVTLLNLSGSNIPAGYPRILAGKFSPRAIYYMLSHKLTESDLGMSICCMEMVEASASGVIYTQDPVRQDKSHMIVSSIFGLGKFLVDGTITPDVFRLDLEDGSVIESHIAKKPVRLVFGPDDGVVEEQVPAEEQERSSITDGQLATLYDLAVSVQAHYGSPQDIEWAIDGEGGVFLIQTRPLRVIPAAKDYPPPDLSGIEALLSEGTTVCPGAGIGPVFPVATVGDLDRVPEGAVLVAPHAFPGLITIMNRINALVTETGSTASHTATIAREYRLPTLVGVPKALALPEGTMVTVDATAGVVYAGAHETLVEAREPEYELFEDIDLFRLLGDLLANITPLNLIQPDSAGFVPDNCRTYHDITRFAHQKATDELFRTATAMEGKNRLGSKLKSSIPLHMNIIYLDRDPRIGAGEWIEEDDLASIPMKAFWEGVKKERWVQENRSFKVKDFVALVASSTAASTQLEYSDNSFAILSREYMIAGLHMGYHFTSIEAMCTEDTNKNFIRMHYKEGGASYDRRIRRTRLIARLFTEMGFENFSKGDFLDSRLSHQDASAILKKLDLVGRLMIMTKQLDMVLSNDAIAQWYVEEFMKKLGMTGSKQLERESDDE